MNSIGLVYKYDRDGTLDWTQRLAEHSVQKIKIDGDRLLVLSHDGVRDTMVLLELDAQTGQVRWQRDICNGDHLQLRYLAVAPNGGIGLSGYFTGSLVVGDKTYVNDRLHVDLFVVRLKPNGDIEQSTHFAQKATLAAVWPNAVAFRKNGNLMIHGGFVDRVNLGDGFVESTIVDGGDFMPSGTDAYVLELDHNLRHVRSNYFAGGRLHPTTMVQDTNEDYALIGWFEDVVRWNRDQKIFSTRSDGYIARFGRNHQLQWTTQLGATDRMYLRDAAMDTSGGVWLAGEFHRSFTFPDHELVAQGDDETANGMVVHYAKNGDFVASISFPSPSFLTITNIVTHSDGGAVATGAYEGPLIIQGQELKPKGSEGVFLIKFKREGADQSLPAG